LVDGPSDNKFVFLQKPRTPDPNHLPGPMTSPCLSSFSDFVACLERMDFTALPGMEGQLLMAPQARLSDIKSRGEGRNAVPSGVLLLFFPLDGGQTGTVFIQRTQYNGPHSGQISFPGGRREAADPDLGFTALRETREEIGVDPADVRLVGKLTDLYIPPSNFIVSPYLGVCDRRPDFCPDPVEVAGVVEVELRSFFLPENRRKKLIALSGGHQLETPCFIINGHMIWGATAMIVSEFLTAMDTL